MSVFRSLLYHRWINLAVLLGVVCATAVLTGALLVGDSMRGSLRALTLDRLGNVDVALQSDGFFEPPKEFLDTALLNQKLPEPWTETRPAILLSGVMETNDRISPTQILATDDAKHNEFVVNRSLADELGAKENDTVSLRMMSPQTIPAENSLGRRDDLIVRARVAINKIIPDTGRGRFSLKADQQAEPLLIVPLEWLQRQLALDEKINTVFFETENPETVSTPKQHELLETLFQPSPADLGIAVTEKDGKTYITSNRMMFTENQAAEIQRVFPSAKPGLLYLATSIKAVKNGREVPYSTVYACDSVAHEPGITSPDNRANSIFLNEWTANDLEANIGDAIELTWFDPNDVTKTRSHLFRLDGILPMNGMGADANLVPEVKGVTDEIAIAAWTPPFPFDAKKIRKQDEDYWDKHRAAPKAFVPLFIGQTLWGTRFGNVTTFVDPPPTHPNPLPPGEGNAKIPFPNFLPAVFGLHFVPLKAQGLAASAGTTPFSVLFLSFSFFIIASALMLVLMLFRLSVEMKARQIGIRLAVGWTPRQIARLLLAEGSVIAVTGSLLGMFFGIFYAKVMVYGLTTWWVDAVTVPFLKFYVTPFSLCSGFFGGVLLALITIAWTLRSVRKVPVKTLLGGDVEVAKKIPSSHRGAGQGEGRPSKRSSTTSFPAAVRNDETRIFGLIKISLPTVWEQFCAYVVTISMFSALSLSYWGTTGFFTTGILVLLYGLSRCKMIFERPITGQAALISLYSLGNFNIARKPGRSLLFVGLVASTTFLVLTISAFRLDSNAQGRFDGRGDGGFAYISETAFPVYHDIATESGREALGIQNDEQKFLAEHSADIVSCRAHGGDNAGCLNLYQSQSPRVLGVPVQKLAERDGRQHGKGAFAFAKPNKRRWASDPSNWSLLSRPVSIDPDGVPRVPVILDANTAMYSLHLYGGIGKIFERKEPDGSVLRCEVVGLLKNSIFQGDILIGEVNFVKLFPDSGGYRMFLFDVERTATSPHPSPLPKGRGDVGKAFSDGRGSEHVVKIFYDLLGDYGFTGEPTADRLRKLFAVQNTYLSTFQSLGGIGLLLGMFGLAVIQLRNIFERRKELALMQALGFTRSRIMLLLLYESFSLLAKGLGLALIASLFALAPFLFGWANQEADAAAILMQFVWLVGGMLLIALVSNTLTASGVLKLPAARELAEER